MASSKPLGPFILREKRNPLVNIFEDKVNSGTIDQKVIHDFAVSAVGGEEKAHKFGLENTKFNLYFYDYEIQLLRDLLILFLPSIPGSLLEFSFSGRKALGSTNEPL